MPEPKLKPLVKPREKKSLTQSEVSEIVFPELSTDQFAIGKRVFRIRCLPWKFEQMFRRHAMPILEAEFKPIERAIFAIKTNEALITNDLKVTESVMKSEVDADIYLLNAMVVICMSQDPEWLAAAAEGVELPLDKQVVIEKKYRSMIELCEEWPSASPRHYIRDVVRRQSDKMDMMQTLGESLMARFAEAAKLMGMNEEYDFLKLDFTRQVSKFMEKAGSLVGARASSSLPSTATGSATNQTAAPSKSSENEQKTPAEDSAVEEAVPVGDAVERVQ